MQIDNTLALNSYNEISANKIKNANAEILVFQNFCTIF